jgi:hypothetical protein
MACSDELMACSRERPATIYESTRIALPYRANVTSTLFKWEAPPADTG